MDKIEKEQVVIDVCPFCGGIFLDDGEIDKLGKIHTQTILKNQATKGETYGKNEKHK